MSGPLTFVIHFNGKVKHETRWASASERCKVESGRCMLDGMQWPEAGELIQVVEKSALDEAQREIKHLKSELQGFKLGAQIEASEGDRARKELSGVIAEIERLKEALSYLPKVPTQPYEKQLAQDLQTANALLEWILEEMKTCRKNWCGTKGCECYVCRTIEKIELHRGNTNG